jgi:hypothetical protein
LPEDPPPPPVGKDKRARVRHPKFGIGTVLSRSGNGDAATLEIRFDTGVKKLHAKFVEVVE